MKNVVFDMETGDPDDLITLLMLLNNPEVNIKAITCYEGSPVQIGLIDHVVGLSGRKIPIAGHNSESKELSPYYTEVVGRWKPVLANITPVNLLSSALTSDTILLTGAPLTNIADFLKNDHSNVISKMVTQGGYLGYLLPEEHRLEKFKTRSEIRSYNLTNDTEAFDLSNRSQQINELTYVTKDLCHGFLYTSDIHEGIDFKDDPISQLLRDALGYYAKRKINKAMHDPLAMLFMLYPDIGNRITINMDYRVDKNNHKVFSSIAGNANSFTFGLIKYDSNKAWDCFKKICARELTPNSNDVNLV